MNIRSNRAVTPLLLVAFIATLLVALAPAADARSRSTYSTSGRAANTNWTQVDGTPVGSSPVGNVHVGWLSAEETSKGKAVVWGFIMDFDCKPGELPGHFGEFAFEEGEPEPEPEPGCVHIGARDISGWNIPFTMDKKLGTATLKGRLEVVGHGPNGGPVVGRPMADITWSGIGDTSRERYTSRWSEGGMTHSDTFRATARQATMGGTLGPMGFDPDLSGGWLVQYLSLIHI